MATSERSRDFLCFRLHRLRTSSDTVSRAAVSKKLRERERGVKKKAYSSLSVLKLAQNSALTSQVGYALCVDLKLVTVEMLPHQAQKHVQDAHCSCHHGGGRVSIAWAKRGRFFLYTVHFPCKITIAETLHASPLSRWPTSAKLKLELKLRPTKWSICLQCHSRGLRISINTSSGLCRENTNMATMSQSLQMIKITTNVTQKKKKHNTQIQLQCTFTSFLGSVNRQTDPRRHSTCPFCILNGICILKRKKDRMVWSIFILFWQTGLTAYNIYVFLPRSWGCKTDVKHVNSSAL